MKHILRANGWELCPYCHKFLIATLLHNIRVLLECPKPPSRLSDEMIHIIFSNTYSTVQNRIVPFFRESPAMLLDDTLYLSPVHWKMTNEFLKEYFRRRWRSPSP